jgi:hypothetical protein
MTDILTHVKRYDEETIALEKEVLAIVERKT